jgi:hypothetical protein
VPILWQARKSLDPRKYGDRMARLAASPVPLFLDVDGSLIATLATVGSIWPSLTQAPLGRQLPADEAFPAEVWFDQRIVAMLNEMIDARLVAPVWMTTWDDSANRLLAPALKLSGAPWPVAKISTRHGATVRAGNWVKSLAVGRWLLENGHEESAFVAVDDLLQSRGRAASAQRRSMDVVGGGESLLVATNPEHGLHREQVAQIRTFVERFASAR